jgi:transaldolase
MIKVPGTSEGASAVRQLIAGGKNVNITLLFAIEAHRRVIEAYFAGLEDRLRAGKPIDRVASVASFFVSRVDTEIDKRLDALAAASPDDRDRILALRGKAAIANAQLAYRLFREEFSSPRWAPLKAAGARLQRPLWASTSSKNPAYRDVLYVEQLIGPDTVNTMPPATIEAFRDHGEVARTVDAAFTVAERTIAELGAVGVDHADLARADLLIHPDCVLDLRSDAPPGMRASSTTRATNASRATAGSLFPPMRGATVPSAASRSPITAMIGTFCTCASRIL